MLEIQQLFAAMPELYLVLTLDFVVVEGSDAYFQATKTTRAAIVGRNVFEVFPENPDALEAKGVQNLRASLESVVQHRQPHTTEVLKYDIRRPESEGGGFEERYWKVVNSPIFDETGKLTHLLNRIEDVTEFVQMQQEAVAANQQVETLLASVRDGFYTFDREWRFIYVNDRWCEMVGMQRENLLGRTIWELFDDLHDTEVYWQFQRGMNDRISSQAEYFYPSRNRWYEHRVYPTPQGLAVLTADITDRKRAELMLVEQKRLLEMIASGQPIDECLTAVCDTVSRLNPLVRASFLLADEQRSKFSRTITPAFPTFGQELQDIPINHLCIGTCGEAVYQGVSITCADIANDDRWSENWRDLCIAHNILACHSTPVIGTDGLPLGSLMLAFDQARSPTDWEYQLAEFGTQIASIGLERDQSSDALRQSAARFRAVAANLPNGAVFLVDRNLRYLLAEGKAIENSGLTSGDFVGKTLWEALDPIFAAQYEPHYRQALGGEPFSLEHYNCDQYYSSHGIPLLNDQGEVDAVLALSYDISDRKQTEITLRQSEARLRLMIESAKEYAIFTLDLNGIFTSWNAGAERLLGYSEADILGQHGRIIFTPEDIERGDADRELQTALTQGQAENERWHVRQDGSRFWGSGLVMPLQDGADAPQGLVKILQDKTTQKQIEAEREDILQRERAAREEAEQANRLKDEFLAVLSHELRSPLNPILGWTRLLQTGKLDSTRQTEALRTIDRNARLQSQLIEDLLDISRIMQGKLSLTAAPVNLTFVISAAIETVRLAAEAKQIQISLDLDSEIPSISGDAGRLQQVVWNLLSNAVKFTPQSGHVTIELRQVDQLAQIQVIDTGKGIDSRFLPYVFEYFRQEDSSTTRRFGGLGLGLAIVRQIVEMHGGTVAVESQGETQGATFIVQLPLMQQTSPTTSEPIQTSVDLENSLSNLQILVVDDDNDTRDLQSFVLEQSGASVTAVASGIEALQILDRFIPDILISDVGMAEMDGYMLIEQIRSRPPDQGRQIPAIALTAYAADIDQQRAIQAGFQAYITKPVEPEALVKAIVDLLRQH